MVCLVCTFITLTDNKVHTLLCLTTSLCSPNTGVRVWMHQIKEIYSAQMPLDSKTTCNVKE